MCFVQSASTRTTYQLRIEIRDQDSRFVSVAGHPLCPRKRPLSEKFRKIPHVIRDLGFNCGRHA